MSQPDEQDKSKKHKKTRKIVVDRELFESPAWLSLTGASTQVYMLFRLRLKSEKTGRRGHEKWIFSNHRALILPYREAEAKYKITQPRFLRAIDDLVEHGFLDIVKPGSGTARLSTLYGVSERWRSYGTPDFEDRTRPKGYSGFRKARCRDDDESLLQNGVYIFQVHVNVCFTAHAGVCFGLFSEFEKHTKT